MKRITEETEPVVKVGTVVQAYGFPMLSGFKGENFYRLMRVEGDTAWFRRCNELGQVGNIGQNEFPASIKNLIEAIKVLKNGISTNGIRIWKENKTTKSITNMKLISLLPINPINEAAANVVALRNKPGDSSKDSNIRIVLMRKIDGNTAWYRLENDNWFRRYLDHKGYGIMIREFKVTSLKPNYMVLKRGVPAYTISVKYLPNNIVDPDEDRPENWVSDKGYLFFGTTPEGGQSVSSEITPKDVEAFIKSQIKNYKP
jgi:hypothetical protein